MNGIVAPAQQSPLVKLGAWWQQPGAMFCSQDDCANSQAENFGELSWVEIANVRGTGG